MTWIAAFANCCSLIGIALAAIIAFRQQSAIRAVLSLSQSPNAENREIAQFLETEHKGFFLGMTPQQLRLFWFAIGMAVFGQMLLTILSVIDALTVVPSVS